MRKFRSAVLYFMTGIICTLVTQSIIFSTIQTPAVFARQAQPQTSQPQFRQSPGEPPILSMFGLDPLSIPRYASLNTNSRRIVDLNFSHAQQILDGLICEKCSFEDSQLVYAGGPFNLKDVTLKGTNSILLTGAAANTQALFNLLNGFYKGKIPASPSPTKRPVQRVIARRPMIVNYAATFMPQERDAKR